MLRGRSLALLLGCAHLLLSSGPARAQCPTRIEASCGNADGDVARCSFVLRSGGEGSPAGPSPSVTLRFADDSSYSAEPSSLPLAWNQAAEAKVTVHRTDRNPGLIRLQGTASGSWGPQCTPKVDISIDFLLEEQRVLLAQGAGIYSADEPPSEAILDLKHVTTFTFKVVDAKSEQVLRVPVTLTATIEAIDGAADLGLNSKSLAPNRLEVTLGERQGSQTVFIRPVTPGVGKLRIQVALDSSRPSIASTEALFRTGHAFPRRIGFVLLGALAYWALLVAARRSGGLRRVLPGLAKAVVVCSIGYFLAPYLGVFGFKFQADPSRLESHFVFGLLLACLGVEGFLGLLSKQVPAPTQAPDRTAA